MLRLWQIIGSKWSVNSREQLFAGKFKLNSFFLGFALGQAEDMAVALGAAHVLAVAEDGALLAWGAGAHGQLGT